MNFNKMYTVIFALVIELSVMIFISFKLAGWVAKTWKWDESLVLVAFFALAFAGWFFHVSQVLQKKSDAS